ncbi:MAG: MCE family protein [Jatrophihabitans sp.]|uniref:MCE family protein n=1 Tax=Jatrophihabitans sp. TaxID=1932789 RepID=UPI003F7E7584
MNWRALVKVIVALALGGVMATMEIGTLTGPHVGTEHAYHAIFAGPDGVSGLRAGNQVKAAGVAVGRVTDVSLVDAQHARVTFTTNDHQTLTTSSWAVVRYANLLGQRYLAITQDGPDPGRPLPYGSTIPASHTRPALSLTALFDGFRPLFTALTPQQVNELSQDIIDILQGQTARITDLVRRTASLTTNLADRTDTFTEVLDSLTKLLTTVSAHDNDLAGVVQALSSLTAGLHQQGPALLGSLDGVDGLAASVDRLLARLGTSGFSPDIADLDHVAGQVAANSGTVSQLIDGFVTAFGDFARTTQNGGFANAYLCRVDARTVGRTSVSGGQVLTSIEHGLGIPGLSQLLNSTGLTSLALLQLPVSTPLALPHGHAGHLGNTAVCR